jgi:hypothetical protein
MSTNIQVLPGKVGISNTSPTHTLDIGSNVYVDDTADNKLTVNGKIYTTDITVASNLTVMGTTTVVNTENLSIKDPIIELARDSLGTGDTGILMKRAVNESNVAVFYDEGVGFKIAHTMSGANGTQIAVDTANTLPINLYGNVTVTSNLEVGTANLFVDTVTGNVGVGTNSPGFSLDVHGTANVGALTTTSVSGDGSGLSALNAGNLGSGTVPSTRLSLVASDIPSLDAGKITTGTLTRPISTTTGTFSGNVGIGTVSPVTPLHISSTNEITTSPAASSVSQMRFGSTNSTVLFGVSSTAGHISAYDTSNFSTHRDLCFNANGGNVGIGTVSPQARFHVKPVNNTADSENTLLDFRGDFTGGNHGFLGIYATETHTNAIGPDLRFKGAVYNGTSSPTINQVMCLKPTGYVGIGTASPIASLDIGGKTFKYYNEYRYQDAWTSNNNQTFTIPVTGGSARGEMLVEAEVIQVASNSSSERMARVKGIITNYGTGNFYMTVFEGENVTAFETYIVGTSGSATGTFTLKYQPQEGYLQNVLCRLNLKIFIGGYTNSLGSLTRTDAGSNSALTAPTLNLAPRIFGGDVGIGTTSPQTKLNVRGSVSTGRNLAREVGSVIDYSSQFNTDRAPANIINGSKNFENGNNDWITASGQRANAYVVIDLGTAYSVDRLVIYNQNEYNNSKREVKGFKLQGSADNSTWTDVITSECGRSNGHEPNPGWSFRIPQNWDDDNEGLSYRYWKFIMTSFHGTDDYGGITELELYEANSALDDEVSTSSLVAEDVYGETGNFSRGATIGKGYGGTSTGANNLLVEGNVGINQTNPTAKLHTKPNHSSYSNPTGTAGVTVYNETNSDHTITHSILSLRTAGSSGGDPFVSYDIASEHGWAVGIDNSVGKAFRFSSNWSDFSSTRAYISDSSTPGELDFTGQHRSFVSNVPHTEYLNLEGLIVSANKNQYFDIQEKIVTGVQAIKINESLPLVSISNVAYDKCCFGVISGSEDTNDREYSQGSFVSVLKKQEGDIRAHINSVGEGAIWVTNLNGTLESGDYITTSNISGYGQKQDSEFLANYTVAKITMDCDFEPTTQPVQIIKKELQDVNYWVKYTYDDISEEEYTRVKNLGRRVRIIESGTEISQEEYENHLKKEGYTITESNTYIRNDTTYQRVFSDKEKEPKEGYQLEVHNEPVNVLDEHGQLQWEDDPSGATEKAYKIRYLDASGQQTDEANAVHIAAFVGCTYHCG